MIRKSKQAVVDREVEVGSDLMMGIVDKGSEKAGGIMERIESVAQQ